MTMNILHWARAVLEKTPARFTALANDLPADLLLLQPAPGEWSFLECLQHLVDTEDRVFPMRVQAILAGEDLPAFDPDSQGTRITTEDSPRALAKEFARLRSEALVIFDRVNPADLDRNAHHQELGIVTLGELLNEWAAHDLMHTVQAERALMQPFIQGSGPWQPYFSDHLIATR